MNFCTKCGKELKQDDIFCTYCGERVVEANNGDIAPYVSTYTAPPLIKDNKPQKSVFRGVVKSFIIVQIVLLFAVIIAISLPLISKETFAFLESDSVYIILGVAIIFAVCLAPVNFILGVIYIPISKKQHKKVEVSIIVATIFNIIVTLMFILVVNISGWDPLFEQIFGYKCCMCNKQAEYYYSISGSKESGSYYCEEHYLETKELWDELDALLDRIED